MRFFRSLQPLVKIRRAKSRKSVVYFLKCIGIRHVLYYVKSLELYHISCVKSVTIKKRTPSFLEIQCISLSELGEAVFTDEGSATVAADEVAIFQRFLADFTALFVLQIFFHFFLSRELL